MVLRLQGTKSQKINVFWDLKSLLKESDELLELQFEYTGSVAEPILGSAHFPDNYLRAFFIDTYTSKLMMTKAQTPYGNFSSLNWTEPAVAFERTRVTDCRLHYMPGEFLFAIAITIKGVPTLLYYSTEHEQFFDVVEVLGKIINFDSESLRSAIRLTWENPISEYLYDRVIIRRKEGSFPTDPEDGVLVYEGRGNEVKDGNLFPNIDYYYRAFPFDVYNDVNDEEEGQTLIDQTLDLVTALYLVHSNLVILEGLRVVDNSDDANVGIYVQNSMSRINNSTISNKETAIEGIFHSYMVSQNNTGTNNEISLRASEGARIQKIGSQPEGEELQEEGGLIT